MSSTSIQERIDLARRDQLPITMDVAPGTGGFAKLTASVIENGGTIVDLRLPMCEREDFTGVASGLFNDKYVGILPTEVYASQYDFVVLLLSDINSATPDIATLAQTLADDRHLNNSYILPENVVVVITNTK